MEQKREEDKELCQKLVTIDYTIQEYKDKINKIKGVVNCDTRVKKEIESGRIRYCLCCGNLIKSDVKFCPECGSYLETQTVKEGTELDHAIDLYD